MATEIKLPELGENIETADIVGILVKSGDTLQLDQPIIEIETDKATVEVPATVEGKIIEVKVKNGDQMELIRRYRKRLNLKWRKLLLLMCLERNPKNLLKKRLWNKKLWRKKKPHQKLRKRKVSLH
jgi:hypothetical protein